MRIKDYCLRSTSLIQVPELKKLLESEMKITVSASTLRNFLRKRLGMSYRRMGLVSILHNTQELKVLRQIAAGNYIRSLGAGTEIFSIDESVLRATDHRCRGWTPYRKKTKACHSQRLFSINIIAAISSQGKVYFTINRGRTNSKTFCLFLGKLIEMLN